jgi:hypothetical protein
MDGLRALVNSKDFIRNPSACRTDSSEKAKRTPKYYHKNTLRRQALLEKTDSDENAQAGPAATFAELLKLDKTFGRLEKIILKQADQPVLALLDSPCLASPSDNFEVRECVIGEAFVLSSGYESVEFLQADAWPGQRPDSSRKPPHSRRTWTFKKHPAAKPQVHEFTFQDGLSSLSQADDSALTVKKSSRLLAEAPQADLQSTHKKNKENVYLVEFPPIQTLQMTRRIAQQKHHSVSSKSVSSQATLKNYEVDVLNHDSSHSHKDDQLAESIKFKPIVTVLQDPPAAARPPKPPEKPVIDVKPIKPAGIQVEMIKLTAESPSGLPLRAPAGFPEASKQSSLASQRQSGELAPASPPRLEQPETRPAGALPERSLPQTDPPSSRQGARRSPQRLDDHWPPRPEEPSDEDLGEALHKSASASSRNSSIRFKSHFRSSSYHSGLRQSSLSAPR